MIFHHLLPDQTIELLVKSILVFEETDAQQKTVLPFFADGHPGLIFHKTEHGLVVSPHNKQMPPFFLYGQTIKPIELVMQGSYQLVIFQLYPFVLKSFFNVDPKSVNDNCYDLRLLETDDVNQTIQRLQSAAEGEDRVHTINAFLHRLFQHKKETLDFKIRQAIQLIIDNKGQTNISQLCETLKLNQRTFERRFAASAGVPAKQFSTIIQFQQSLEQLTVKDYRKLTDIVYANGFADQSHFIKVFKAFT
jgi:AraC-like DNA-binding protein